MPKLYKVFRRYGIITILEMCWAENEDDAYTVLLWEKKDKPTLEIEEIPIKRGCFLSVSIK
jgi:hypothetical protein